MSTPIITSQTTIAEITNLLSQCGCPDITYRLDLPRCSQWRVNGGGQGDIHEGTLVDGARVAIKVSRGDQSIDISKGDKSFKRVARELYTWFTLSHPNIAELLGMAVFQGRISMISPWITPGDFYKFINAFPEADRMDLCLQVANGLAYLHKNKVIFGDLKAQNILIGSDGIAKLTDFGLSILEKSHILFSTTSTTGGGSARWMAPELIEGLRERSFAADVYALAMTFIEILTGNVPFPDISDDTRVMFEVFYNKIVPSCPERLQVKNLRHREWWRLLTQCWCQQPEMRPQAVDWGLLDQTVTARRTEYLSEWLEYALRYGRTKSGSFEVLDTGVHMFFPNSTTTTFFVPEHVKGSGSESKEAALQALISQYTSATSDTRQPNLDATYVNTLQDSIDKDLKQRIHQVRHWIAINVARFPRDQNIHNIFASLDARALEMKAAARICSAKCSDCTQLCLRVYGHVDSEHKCPGHISTPVHRILPKSSSFYRQMATEDAARCIRVQDLDHMLMSPQLPSRDAIVLGIEWQRGWYLPHESLVVLVRDNHPANRHQGVWWIRLARFLSHDFITPHRVACPVQRPHSVVRADMKFTGGLAFGHLIEVISTLHWQITTHYSNLHTDSWFYAATVFELLTCKGLFVPAWSERRLTYQDHPTAEHSQREQFQEIFSRVEQLLGPEGFGSHVEAPGQTPTTQSWGQLKHQLDSGFHRNALGSEDSSKLVRFAEPEIDHRCRWVGL